MGRRAICKAARDQTSRQLEIKYYNAASGDQELLHGQRQIVPVATFVAALEVVSAGCQNRAVGQVAKGAIDRTSGGIVDHGND